MNYLSIISDNNRLAVLLFCAVMLLGELAYAKQHWHYSQDTKKHPNMKEHLLNKKYHLDQRSDVDVAAINSTIAKAHCAVIIVSGIVMFFYMLPGALLFLFGQVLVSLFIIERIGRQYTHLERLR